VVFFKGLKSKIKTILFLILLILTWTFIFKPYLHEKMICENFSGGPMGRGQIRGVECDCKGYELFLERNAGSDGQNYSLCLGIRQNVRPVY
jgi:hypothetical protein